MPVPDFSKLPPLKKRLPIFILDCWGSCLAIFALTKWGKCPLSPSLQYYLLVTGSLAVVTAFVKFFRPKSIYSPEAEFTPTDLTGMCYLPLVIWGIIIVYPNTTDGWNGNGCSAELFIPALICTTIPTIIIGGMFIRYLAMKFIWESDEDDPTDNIGKNLV